MFLPRIHARGFKTIQVQGETHWRDVSARFSFIAKAMALPPSSYSRFAAKLEGGDRGRKSCTQSLGQLQQHCAAAWVPSWGLQDLLQLPEGAVGPQGAGDGRAPLLADRVLPQAGERDRAWRGAAKAGLQLLPHSLHSPPGSGAVTICCKGQSI